MNKDVKEIIRRVKAEGWTVADRGSGHYRAESPDGDVVVLPKTPSDNRSLLNTKAEFKRKGLDLDEDDNVMKRLMRAQKREDDHKKNLEALRVAEQRNEQRKRMDTETTKQAMPTSSRQTANGRVVDDFPKPSVRRVMESCVRLRLQVVTVGDIHRATGLHRTTVNVALRWLVDQGLIEYKGKVRHSPDKRVGPAYQVTEFGVEYWRELAGGVGAPQWLPSLSEVAPEVPTPAGALTVAEPPAPVEMAAPVANDVETVVGWIVRAESSEVVDALVVVLKWLKGIETAVEPSGSNDVS